MVSRPKEFSLLSMEFLVNNPGLSITLASFFSVFMGYVILASYTLPRYFIPIVSYEILPLIMLLFFAFLAVFVASLTLIFWPILILIWRQELNAWYERNRGLYLNIVIAASFFICIIMSMLMVQFISIKLSLVSAIIILLLMFLFTYLFWSNFVHAFKSRLQSLFLSLLGLFFLVLYLPVMLPAEVDIKSFGRHLNPNWVVEAALLRTGLGGGIEVEISTKDAPKEFKRYKLLFYDGSKAWVDSSGRVLEVPVFELRRL